MPVTRIDVYKKGGFYGDMRSAPPRRRRRRPTTRRCSGCPRRSTTPPAARRGCRTTSFGLPKGQLLHLSYGRCKLFALLDADRSATCGRPARSIWA